MVVRSPQASVRADLENYNSNYDLPDPDQSLTILTIIPCCMAILSLERAAVWRPATTVLQSSHLSPRTVEGARLKTRIRRGERAGQVMMTGQV